MTFRVVSAAVEASQGSSFSYSITGVNVSITYPPATTSAFILSAVAAANNGSASGEVSV